MSNLTNGAQTVEPNHKTRKIIMKIAFALCALLLVGAMTVNAQDKPKAKADPEAMFKKKDANGDGKLSKEEFTKGAKDPAKAEAAFDKMAKDGFVSKEDFIANAGKKKGK